MPRAGSRRLGAVKPLVDVATPCYPLRQVVRVGAAAVLVMVSACAHVDRAALGTAAALTLCDAAGTYKASAAGWGAQDMAEANPVLGREPSTGAVTLYFASAITAEVVAWGLLPKKYRPPTLGFVGGIEASSVVDNLGTVGLCGF